MKRIIGYIVLLSLSVLLWLALTLPARIGFGLLQHVLMPTMSYQLAAVSGTVWQGEMQDLSIDIGSNDQQFMIPDVRWSIIKTGLLAGQLRYAISGRIQPNFIVEGIIAIDSHGDITVAPLTVNGPIAGMTLDGNLPINLLLGGNIVLSVEQAKLVNGQMDTLVGDIKVDDLYFDDVAIGNFIGRISRDGDAIVILFEDVGVTALQSNGRITLDADGYYQLSFRLRSGNDKLQQLLQPLPLTEDGWRQFSFSGYLPNDNILRRLL